MGTAANLEDFTGKDKFVVVAYLDKADTESHSELKRFAEEARDMFLVGLSTDKELAKARGKSLTSDEIKSFVQVESLPLVSEISADNFLQYATSGLPLAYYFADPASSTLEDEVKKLADVAREVRGKVNLVRIDATKYGS